MPLISVDATGHIKLYAANSIPTGYIACDGSVVTVSSYPSLYNVIGPAFNTGGEAPGTFRLPDFRGKTRVGHGQDTTRGLAFRTIGQYIGEENTTLSIANLANHTHSGSTNASLDTHTHTGAVNSNTISHYHNFGQNTHGDANNSGHASEFTGYSTYTTGTPTISLLHNHSVSLVAMSNTHTHSFSSDGGYGVDTLALPAISAGHNNMAPSIALIMCIKY